MAPSSSASVPSSPTPAPRNQPSTSPTPTGTPARASLFWSLRGSVCGADGAAPSLWRATKRCSAGEPPAPPGDNGEKCGGHSEREGAAPSAPPGGGEREKRPLGHYSKTRNRKAGRCAILVVAQTVCAAGSRTSQTVKSHRLRQKIRRGATCGQGGSPWRCRRTRGACCWADTRGLRGRGCRRGPCSPAFGRGRWRGRRGNRW